MYISFYKIPKEILEKYNLESDDFIDVKFTISYEIIIDDENSDDDIQEESYVLKTLTKVK